MKKNSTILREKIRLNLYKGNNLIKEFDYWLQYICLNYANEDFIFIVKPYDTEKVIQLIKEMKENNPINAYYTVPNCNMVITAEKGEIICNNIQNIEKEKTNNSGHINSEKLEKELNDEAYSHIIKSMLESPVNIDFQSNFKKGNLYFLYTNCDSDYCGFYKYSSSMFIAVNANKLSTLTISSLFSFPDVELYKVPEYMEKSTCKIDVNKVISMKKQIEKEKVSSLNLNFDIYDMIRIQLKENFIDNEDNLEVGELYFLYREGADKETRCEDNGIYMLDEEINGLRLVLKNINKDMHFTVPLIHTDIKLYHLPKKSDKALLIWHLLNQYKKKEVILTDKEIQEIKINTAISMKNFAQDNISNFDKIKNIVSQDLITDYNKFEYNELYFIYDESLIEDAGIYIFIDDQPYGNILMRVDHQDGKCIPQPQFNLYKIYHINDKNADEVSKLMIEENYKRYIHK